MGLSAPCRTRLLEIARSALLEKLNNTVATPLADPAPTETELTTPAGCFVSLHERSTHRLRGCVGRIDPHLPLWENVRHSAGEVLHDPRFTEQPVTADDLPDLEIEVSVLSPPREAKSSLDFDLKEGIYLIFGGRAGFFLPQVARETGWNKEQLLDRLCTEKLGMPPESWRKPEAKLYTFEVEVIGPTLVQFGEMRHFDADQK